MACRTEYFRSSKDYIILTKQLVNAFDCSSALVLLASQCYIQSMAPNRTNSINNHYTVEFIADVGVYPKINKRLTQPSFKRTQHIYGYCI